MLDVKELHAKALKLNKKIDKLREECATIKQQIAENCQCEELEDKSSWSCGGYDYEGASSNWQQCKMCGKVFNLKVRYTGFS